MSSLATGTRAHTLKSRTGHAWRPRTCAAYCAYTVSAYTVHILCIYCAGSHGYTHLPLCGSRARRDGGGNLAYGELVKILRKRPGGSTAAVMALTKIKKATA